MAYSYFMEAFNLYNIYNQKYKNKKASIFRG